MSFTPQDPDYEKRVRSSFARQKFVTGMGAVIEELEPGRVTLAMRVSAELTQQHGFVHAGALATLADSACGYAALTLMPKGSGVLSVEFKINMLSPARGETVRARGEVIRAGRNIMVCRADVHSVTGGDEKLVAAMQGTMMVATGVED